MAVSINEFHWPAYWPPNINVLGLHPLYTRLMSNQIIDELLAILPVVDEAKADQIRLMDLPGYMAFNVPHSTSRERLIILCKWGACMILLDDLLEYPWFTEEEIPKLMQGLKNLPANIRLLVENNEDSSDDNCPQFVHYIQCVFEEMFASGATKEQIMRMADLLERFITAVTEEEEFVANRFRFDNPDQWSQCRAAVTGMYMVMQLMEFALEVKIPAHIWNDATMQTLLYQGSLQSGILNDLYSLPKEIRLNNGQIKMNSMNWVAYLIRTTDANLQTAIDLCRDRMIEIDGSVAHAANTVKSRFDHDKTVCQFVDAMVYTLYGTWAYQLTSSRYWLRPQYGLKPVPLSGEFRFIKVDGKEIPEVVPDENEVNDRERFWWNRELV